jgi:hypothetical protein
MKIEENTLIIDQPLDDDALEEISATVDQEKIKIIKVENDNLSSSIIQLLWCASKDKKIEIQSEFLNNFFTNVKSV